MTSLAGFRGGCCPAFGGGGGGGSTARDFLLDLRSDSTIVVTGDGPVAVNGYEWDVHGFAQSDVFRFESAGCRIRSRAGTLTSYDGDFFDNAPRIELPIDTQLTELIANITGHLEIWADWTTPPALPTNNNTAFVGLSGIAVNQYAKIAVGSGLRRASDGLVYPQAQDIGSTNIGGDATQPGDCTLVRYQTEGQAMHYSGIMPGGDDWPTTLSPIARTTTFSTDSISLLLRRSADGLPTIYFAVSSNSIGGAPEATLRRILVRLYPPS